jgi:hypothetical protein
VTTKRTIRCTALNWENFLKQLEEHGLRFDNDYEKTDHALTHCTFEQVENLSVNPDAVQASDSDEIGPLACPFRKVRDTTTFTCLSLKPAIRVQRDGTVEKEDCRLCERLQAEESFLIRATVTPSGENYKTFLIQKRERRRQEQLEYLKEKERIKTEALKQRQTIRRQNPSQARVDWGDQGPSCDSFEIGDGYRG